MKKILVVPDSFKGSLSAVRAAEIIGKAICDADPTLTPVLIPVADGGEGTVDVLGATRIPCQVLDANFQRITAFWGELNQTAIIELAACAGLVKTKCPNPEKTTTFGVGELILDALNKGKRDFIIALGGSSTNDLGCGLASALGVEFFDENEMKFVPTGETLHRIEKIDISKRDRRLSDCKIIAMCDVTNPLFGSLGAAFVFAPQKGADPEMVSRLDEGLKHAAEIIQRDLGIQIDSIPGAGAAGGCGGGVVAFLQGKIKSGIDSVLDIKDFNNQLKNASLVLTGEGTFDSQSLSGKVISGIASRAKSAGVPLVVLAGCAKETDFCYEMGISAVFSIQRGAMPLSQAMIEAENALYKTAYNVVKLFECN